VLVGLHPPAQGKLIAGRSRQVLCIPPLRMRGRAYIHKLACFVRDRVHEESRLRVRICDCCVESAHTLHNASECRTITRPARARITLERTGPDSWRIGQGRRGQPDRRISWQSTPNHTILPERIGLHRATPRNPVEIA